MPQVNEERFVPPPGWKQIQGRTYPIKDQLKEMVPSSCRSWEPETKTWWIHPDYYDEVMELLEKDAGGQQRFNSWYEPPEPRRQYQPPPRRETPPPPPSTPAPPRQRSCYEVLGLTPSCTQAEAEARRRKLAMENHPDRVGHMAQDYKDLAHSKMAEINNAMDQLTKKRGW